MEWLLANPQIHSTFSSLGRMDGDTYVVSPDVLATLEEIYCKLSCEDQILRTYRRALGFGQNVKTDLVPLLLNAKEPTILDATIRILVNLTVPVECLFSVDVMYRTEVGRHTIFEINKLLITSKEAFTDAKTTKSILDYIKQLLECDSKLSISQCDSINNCLLLLRNILHIPEDNIVTQGHHNSSCTSMQNIIMRNLFIQSIDKLLIYLMSCSRRVHWGVTLVQLIALMYKDQHVSILQKLLNLWVEASLSESSEDNESNTSPPKQGSGDSSPMLTSDPTSDSSDNGSGKQDSSDDCRQLNICKETDSSTGQLINRKGHDYLRVPAKPIMISKNQPELMQKPVTKHTKNGSNNSGIKDPHQKTLQITDKKQKNFSSKSPTPSTSTTQYNSGKCCPKKRECTSPQSELSDCGYGTQVENQESISTSSNEDEFLHKKPMHQKPPTNQKQRYSTANKQRPLISTQDKKELRRKKLVKRSKSNLINMKGLVQHIPTDEDISNILKEFTVDFLLKGYGYLVKELHAQLLSDSKVQIDTSHFFWLVTYFLKFAAQLELDLEHINSVLCFDIVSFLTYEAVMLCEQLDLAARQSESDLKPYLRRMHLVVTAIREIFQALETYKKATHLSEDDKICLHGFELQVSSTEDLRNLFVLLIRRYNPLVQSKQYLQDIIVTNHVLLIFLDRAAKFPESDGNFKMTEHITQFATVEIMHHYGLLLQDFRENGEFVNDCIFTMMHHIAGDLGKISTLFQPGILKAFSQIWETEYELCDDWSDLIEYVIHKFMNTPRKGSLLPNPSLTEMTKEHNMEHTVCNWTQEEMDTLYWYYVQSKKLRDVVGKIASLFAATDNTRKSRLSIVQQLLQQDIITLVEYDDLMKYEDAEYQRNVTKTPTPSTSTGESGIEIKDTVFGKPFDDIQVLKDRLIKEKKGKMLIWLQKILIECYFVKLNFATGKTSCKDILELTNVKVMEPIVHHCILKNKSIPIVSWNADQAAVLQYQPFILLLHKLGFHLPADVGKVFVRIPDFWTADILFEIAKKVGPVNKSMVKFDIEVLNNARLNTEELKPLDETPNEGFAIPRIKHSSSLIRFTPDPASKPPVPNWLEVVMRSKSTSADRHEKLCSSPCGTFVIPSTSFNSESSTSKMHQSDEDSSQAKEMSNVYSAMVASVYDHDFSNSDETNSVASDLTRMYVSDEDDKHNIGHT